MNKITYINSIEQTKKSGNEILKEIKENLDNILDKILVILEDKK